MRRVLAGAAVAATMTGAALPGQAAADTATDRAAERVARLVAAQVPGARVARDASEPLVGVPGFADLAAGRAEVMADPAFWTQVVSNLVVSQTVVLPMPVDVVKPEQALPTAPVATGDGPVWPLPRRPVDLDDVTYEWQGREKTLADYMHSTETDGVAFVHNGRVVDDLYANGWSAEVRHQPWSVTKSFVSALVGIAVDEGRVRSIEEPIDAYIPETAKSAWKGTTIRNLLEMESGVHWDEGTPVLAVNTQVQQWVQAALDLVTDGAAGQTRNEFLLALPRVAPQGTKFSYNSGNTQVLAWLLERVYGKPFNEIISEKLWKPTGMAGDARVMTDRVGDAIASQGLYSRIFDLARFGELFRHGGRTPDGRQIVSAKWVRESTSMTKVSEGNYAYQWWRGATPGAFEASGFQGQKIAVGPNECLVGVRLAHTLGGNLRPGDDPSDPASYGFAVEMGAGEWDTVFRAVAKRLGGCDPAPAPAAAPAPRRLGLRLGRVVRKGDALRVVVGARRARTALTLRATTRRGGKAVTFALRRLTLPAGRARTVSVPLTRAGRRIVRAGGPVRVTVGAVGIADGATGRAARTVRVR